MMPARRRHSRAELRLQLRRDRQLRQTRQPVRRHRVEIANPLGEQQRLRPVAVRRSLLNQPLVFAVRALGVLLLRGGNHDHPAGVELAPHVARKRAHELVDVDAVRLGPARPPVDRHARRLDLVGVVSRRCQRAIKPVAVAAGLEANMDLDRNAGALLLCRRRTPQQRQQPIQVAALDLCRRTAHFCGVPTPTSHFDRLSSNATKIGANSCPATGAIC